MLIIVSIRLKTTESIGFGAVMYLFEGYFGRILYTGDFRYDELMFDYIDVEQPIDHLFLDTTYCKPEYSHFPSKVSKKNFLIHLVVSSNEADREDHY
jgi:Cft2 family RNA processing exonuclease